LDAFVEQKIRVRGEGDKKLGLQKNQFISKAVSNGELLVSFDGSFFSNF
jgi:hypothetical protein